MRAVRVHARHPRWLCRFGFHAWRIHMWAEHVDGGWMPWRRACRVCAVVEELGNTPWWGPLPAYDPMRIMKPSSPAQPTKEKS